MKQNAARNVGIQEFCKQYQNAFRIPENLNHYSDKDFRNAERCFLRHIIINGKIEPPNRSRSLN